MTFKLQPLAEGDGETIRAELISWAEANPVDAALLLSRTANDRPIIELIDLIAWGKDVGMKGLPEIGHDGQPQ